MITYGQVPSASLHCLYTSRPDKHGRVVLVPCKQCKQVTRYQNHTALYLPFPWYHYLFPPPPPLFMAYMLCNTKIGRTIIPHCLHLLSVCCGSGSVLAIWIHYPKSSECNTFWREDFFLLKKSFNTYFKKKNYCYYFLTFKVFLLPDKPKLFPKNSLPSFLPSLFIPFPKYIYVCIEIYPSSNLILASVHSGYTSGGCCVIQIIICSRRVLLINDCFTPSLSQTGKTFIFYLRGLA